MVLAMKHNLGYGWHQSGNDDVRLLVERKRPFKRHDLNTLRGTYLKMTLFTVDWTLYIYHLCETLFRGLYHHTESQYAVLEIYQNKEIHEVISRVKEICCHMK